jgi:catalase (peroxidase I)
MPASIASPIASQDNGCVVSFAAGLTAALELLKEVTDKREGVSYADVFQLASATAIELAGGPKIPLRFGRRDARNEEDCCPEGRLPGCCSTLL